jgi:hypothetical protein
MCANWEIRLCDSFYKALKAMGMVAGDLKAPVTGILQEHVLTQEDSCK